MKRNCYLQLFFLSKTNIYYFGVHCSVIAGTEKHTCSDHMFNFNKYIIAYIMISQTMQSNNECITVNFKAYVLQLTKSTTTDKVTIYQEKANTDKT